MVGFFIVDKPQGITSFDVIWELRKKFHIKKMGHLGTLDPMATGVLVVAVGEATKMIEFFMGADKTYEAEITFGKISNTYDAEGEIKEITTKANFDFPTLEKSVKEKFSGKITQLPPKFSALQINGKKA